MIGIDIMIDVIKRLLSRIKCIFGKNPGWSSVAMPLGETELSVKLVRGRIWALREETEADVSKDVYELFNSDLGYKVLGYLDLVSDLSDIGMVSGLDEINYRHGARSLYTYVVSRMQSNVARVSGAEGMDR
jgi:hypothetical protein